MTKYHFVGIGGIGMSGLARILHQEGFDVSGSDVMDSEPVQDLLKMGINVAIGHSAENVPENACVVYSSGIKRNNPEMMEPLLHRSQLLQRLMEDSKSLVVTGTHGKTTTASLLAHVLLECHLDPSYALGGILINSGVNGAKGKGPYFVAEGDESDGSFLNYTPFGAIITNIGLDHMDYYQNEEALHQAFKTFGEKVKHLFYCIESERVKACQFAGVSYGFSEEAELRGSNFRQSGWSVQFDVDFDDVQYLNVEVPLVGYHNGLNALAVFGMCLRMGLNELQIRAGLMSFKGVKRRCEFKGSGFEVDLRDDYAHHPTEIKATLKGIKSAAKGRFLQILFQPHRYSRTKNCLKLFANAFDDADEVVITDIYGAGEPHDPSIHAQDIVKEIQSNSKVSVRYDSTLELRPLTVAVTMGAGDIWKEGENLLKNLKVKKYRLGLIFGGKSSEHEVSLRSAYYIDRQLDRDIFEVVYFYISKKGIWHVVKEVSPCVEAGEVAVSGEVLNVLNGLDLAFPVLHGPNGEDGTLQGFLEMLNIPYMGSDHQSSAICMDKAVTKKLVKAKGIKTAQGIDFSIYDWKAGVNLEALSYPVFVKPAHLGSAVGVVKVETKEELYRALDHVFTMDNHVVIEEEICGREIEFAVFGAEHVVVFPPGEVISGGSLYNYEAKYGQSCFKTTPTADLDAGLIKKGMELAKQAYKGVGCDGFARVDFFLVGDQFILNEINPIPGFTESSLYPKMCEANGLSVKKLLTELAALGLSRSRCKELF